MRALPKFRQWKPLLEKALSHGDEPHGPPVRLAAAGAVFSRKREHHRVRRPCDGDGEVTALDGADAAAVRHAHLHDRDGGGMGGGGPVGGFACAQ